MTDTPRRAVIALVVFGAGATLGTRVVAANDQGLARATHPAEAGAPSLGRDTVPPVSRPDPAAMPLVTCSLSEPLCVHAPSSAFGMAMLRVLELGERITTAYRALGLPRPLSDGALGGGPAYDFYVVPGRKSALTVADPPAFHDGWDRSSAFTLLGPPPENSDCSTFFDVARGLGDAVCLRLDGAIETGAMAMMSSYLASVVAPCDTVEIPAVDEFQRHPERSFFADDAAQARGSLLFPWFLDDVYGRADIGKVFMSVIALAAQRTPQGSWAWHNEPDVADVLSATMKARGSTFDTMLLEFAVARAFVGDRSDGVHLGGSERFGPSGRVRFEWAIPYDSLPRRLAPGTPIDPTGSTYIWVDLRGVSPSAELTFVAEWEIPSIFRWSLIKVDARGAAAARVDVAGIYGSTRAEQTVVGLEGLAGLLVVGVNAGSFDRSHPFHPDEQPLMPHAYTVTLAP